MSNEKNTENKYIENEIKKSIKISNGSKEAQDEYLVSRNICPVCKRISIIRTSVESYCDVCGHIYNDVIFYNSHGTEFDDGNNRREIYTPPSTRKNASTPYYGMSFRGARMNSSAKNKFYKLSRVNYLVNSSFSKNSQIVKKVEILLGAVPTSRDAEIRNLLIESVLMFYIKIQKRFRGWKKINIDSVLYLASQQLGVKIDLKQLYEYESNEKISLNKFKRNVKRGIEKIFSVLNEEERVELKEFILKQIIIESKTKNPSDEDVRKIMGVINDIYKIYPNITFYDAAKTILSYLYKNKNYKTFPEGINEKIKEIVDKKLRK